VETTNLLKVTTATNLLKVTTTNLLKVETATNLLKVTTTNLLKAETTTNLLKVETTLKILILKKWYTIVSFQKPNSNATGNYTHQHTTICLKQVLKLHLNQQMPHGMMLLTMMMIERYFVELMSRVNQIHTKSR